MVLVHVHAFYADQVPGLTARLNALLAAGERLDAFVTAPPGRAAEIKSLVAASLQSAKFVEVPNAGYDVAPFLEVLRRVDLADYDLVVKLHTKGRSYSAPFTRLNGRYLSDDFWADTLVNSLVGSVAIFARNREMFAADASIGMAGSCHCVVSGDCDVMAANAELAKMGLPPVDSFDYVAGTMFVARASLLRPLLRCAPESFPESGGSGGDASPAHVMERAFGAMVAAQRFRVAPLPEPAYRLRFMAMPFARVWRFATSGLWRRMAGGKNPDPGKGRP